MSAASCYYAVRHGRNPGIYQSWYDSPNIRYSSKISLQRQECEQQVKRFKGARYKKFTCRSDAEAFIRGQSPNFVPKQKHYFQTLPDNDVDILLDGYSHCDRCEEAKGEIAELHRKVSQLLGRDLQGLDMAKLREIERTLHVALDRVKEKIEDEMECKICNDKAISIVFIPCGKIAIFYVTLI